MTSSLGAGDVSTPGGEVPASNTSRTSRVFGAVRVGYVYQAIVLVAGIWLTPFLIRKLGGQEYGLWLNGAQIISWLYIMDLGVVALLPRETAYAIGAAATNKGPSELPQLIDRTTTLLLWQLPFVAIVTAVVWVLLPGEYVKLAKPLLLIFSVFVVGFPLRILQALLQGMQDLVYVAVQTLIAWIVGFLLTIFLVNSLGLYALALSYVAVQCYQYAAYWYRIQTHHRHVLPRQLTPLAWKDARALLTSGTWVSVAQIAQVLLAGTDILIITNVMDAAAVVPYTITAKLAMALANQPAAIMQAALPGIAEIRGTADRERLQRAASALGQILLILSCAVFCVVLALNKAFVGWWPGLPPGSYGGNTLTALILLAMVARHANFAIVYTLFSLGGERRISITTLSDGLVTVLASVLLVRAVGVIGAPLGSILGVSLISVPANLRGLATRSGVSVQEWLRPFWGLAWRFFVLGTGAAFLATFRIPPTVFALVFIGALVGTLVMAVMAPIALRPPLGLYLSRALRWPWAR